MSRLDETQLPFHEMGFCVPVKKDATHGPPSHTSDGFDKAYRPAKLRFKLIDIHLATWGFNTQFLVANAALSQIFRARLSDRNPVFVKRAWPGDRYWDGQLALENERRILSSCKGTYLLNLVGVSDDTPERVLLLDHVSHGNLFDALHNNTLGSMEWPVRTQIAHHISVALRGLHGARSQIIHRDVKSSNVWINHNWNAKLGGFEFGLRVCRSSSFASLAKCPLKAMAAIDPNYEAVEHLCAKTDVFCFGVLLLEIISGRKAMDVNHHPPFVVDWALPLIHQGKVNLLCDPKTRPPSQNSKVVLDMARIAARCVTTMSSRRPTMAEVAEELKMLSLELPLFAQKGCKRGLEWASSAAVLAAMRPSNIKRSSNVVEKIRPDLVRAGTDLPQSKANRGPAFRCERPSMMFGMIAPQVIPSRSYLAVLENAIVKRQREPHLPPHLRHGIT